MDLDPYSLRMIAITLIILVCSFVLHEWGHAWMADRLGDDTPRSQGRVTLNPIVHIDPLGSIIIPILCALGYFGGLFIGWAKPVFTNPANFRRGHLDQALVTIAGPGMNVVLAIGATVAAVITARLGLSANILLRQAVEINVMLVVINLLPIPPLDGSKFLIYFGLMREETYARFSMFGGLILIGLLYLPPFTRTLNTLIGLGMVPFDLLSGVLGGPPM